MHFTRHQKDLAVIQQSLIHSLSKKSFWIFQSWPVFVWPVFVCILLAYRIHRTDMVFRFSDFNFAIFGLAFSP